MEDTQQWRSFGLKQENRRPPYRTYQYAKPADSSDAVMAPAVCPPDGECIILEKPKFRGQQSINYYARLSLKVALWIIFAWFSSHLHPGAPFFLLPLICWLYSESMQRALNWARWHARGPAV